MMTTGRTDPNNTPVMVRVDQVAEIGTTRAASEIRRLNMSREVVVSADVSGRRSRMRSSET
jgi:HAE1 family hydrophobic/amphiphilic exporter-1